MNHIQCGWDGRVVDPTAEWDSGAKITLDIVFGRRSQFYGSHNAVYVRLMKTKVCLRFVLYNI